MDALRIETARLVLRLAEPNEARVVLDYLERNRSHLGPWEPDPPEGWQREEFMVERLAANQREHGEGRHVRVHLFEGAKHARIVGTISLSNIVRAAFQSAHLGFGLDQHLEGKGYMREALEAMIAHAFEPMNLHRLEANHQPQNLRSAGLLRRLGFVPTGFARDYLLINGTWRDHVQTSLINPNWKTR